MPKPEDYIGIQAWGSYMGSRAYYITEQQNRAMVAQAPLDTIYENYDAHGRTGTWSTARELPEDHEFRAIYKRAGGAL